MLRGRTSKMEFQIAHTRYLQGQKEDLAPAAYHFIRKLQIQLEW